MLPNSMNVSKRHQAAVLPGDHRALEPPDPIPNSVVKRCIADGSVEFLHVRVGHRQAFKYKTPIAQAVGVFFMRVGDRPRLLDSVWMGWFGISEIK